MRYGTLGDSGLLVSEVGLGCNNFGGRLDVEQTRAVVDAAIDEGITLFDTAETYGGDGASELALGEVLQGRRDKVVLATKFGHRNSDMGYGPAAGAKGSRNYIKIAVEKSLARLKTDYIDLYQLHTPDPVTPIDETLAALDDLVTEGKVRYLGHSNFSGWQIADAAHSAVAAGRTPFISAQNHWSLLERDAELEVVPASLHFGVGVLPYFPLASGMLTGKIRRGQAVPEGTRLAEPRRAGYITDAKLDAIESLAAWGEEQGVSILQIAIGPARLLLGHRRRHLRRPGPGQRGGRPVAADRRPAGRHRQASPAPRPAAIKVKGFKSSYRTHRPLTPSIADPVDPTAALFS
jgi:aryl-alcohol dehydrogenase-like predicted oxidoreductase